MQNRGGFRGGTLSFRELRIEEIVVRKHIHTACLSLLAIVAAGAVITYLRSVLVPFVLATMLFYSLAPMVDLLSIKPSSHVLMMRPRSSRSQSPEMIVRNRSRENSFDSTEFKSRDPGVGPDWMHLGLLKKAAILVFQFLRWLVRSRLPRPVAVVVALLLACLVIAGLMVVVFSSVNELVAHSDKYTERIHAMVDWIVKMGGSVGVEVSSQAIADKLLSHTGFISELLLDTLRLALEELTNGFLMLLFTVYLLLGYAPDDRRQSSGSVRAEIETQVKRYIGYKVLLSASTGVLVGASLLLLRVDLALVFGLLAFLLNFIPNVGSVISVALPMPVVIFDPSKTWVDIWLVFIIPTCAQ
jgi:predicted PurR-regulated permease PerM